MKEAYLKLKKEFINKKDPSVVVAVSGGPDSMALLNLLIRLKKIINLNIICAHVNHNTGRSGQKEEQQFVKNYCLANEIIFETMIISKYDDSNFHSQARKIRYTFFEKLIKKYDAKYLLTAHHGDDLIETVLMRIVRGSTLKGYSGFSSKIKKDSYTILRPFIKMTKQDIVNYNLNNNIEYANDSSNSKDVYTRNRYRKYILPVLKNENENVNLKFYEFSKLLQKYDNYVQKESEKAYKNLYKNQKLNIEKFLKLDSLLQYKILYLIFDDLYVDNIDLITSHHVKLLLKVILSKKANCYIHLPNKIKAIKKYDKLYFDSSKQVNHPYHYILSNYQELPNNYVIEKISETTKFGNDICCINSEEINLPLIVRTRQDGDKMTVKNMEGHKKINDIFIDCKISKEDRDRWPIVTDSTNKIIWLPNLKKSQFDKTDYKNCDIILKYCLGREKDE